MGFQHPGLRPSSPRHCAAGGSVDISILGRLFDGYEAYALVLTGGQPQACAAADGWIKGITVPGSSLLPPTC